MIIDVEADELGMDLPFDPNLVVRGCTLPKRNRIADGIKMLHPAE